MQFVKNLGRVLSSSVFKLSLGLLVLVAPLIMVFGTPGPLKQALKSSKIYDQAVDSAVSSSVDVEGSGDAASTSQTELNQAAKTAITPEFIQNSSEQIIDGVYGWLTGKTAQPEFRIDASTVKQQIIQATSDQAVAKAKELPACTLQQTRAFAGSSVDPFNLPCLPPGYDINLLRGEVAKQVGRSEGDFLQNPIITPSTLPKDQHGNTAIQNLTTNAAQAPDVFRWLKRAPWILGTLAVISGGLVIWLYDDKRRAIRNLAFTTLGLGAVVIAGILFTNYAFGQLGKPNGALTQNIKGSLQQPVLAVTKSLADSINSKLIFFGSVYALIGASTLIALHYTKPKTTTPTANESVKNDPKEIAEPEPPKPIVKSK